MVCQRDAIVAANQINKAAPSSWRIGQEHPTCWGVDYDNLTYFQHLLSTALADGIQVPMWFSGCIIAPTRRHDVMNRLGGRIHCTG